MPAPFAMRVSCAWSHWGGCVLVPCFHDEKEERRFRKFAAEDKVRFAFAVWLILALVYGVLVNLGTVLEFAQQSTSTLAVGESLHVVTVVLRLLITLLLVHATVAAWAVRRRSQLPTVRAWRPNGPRPASAEAAEAPAQLSDGSSRTPATTPSPILTDSTARSADPRWWHALLRVTGWAPSFARPPVSASREFLAVAVLTAVLFNVTVVIREIAFQRCTSSGSATDCGLSPSRTDAPTLLYAPGAIFADIYFASAVVLFQFSVVHALCYLGLLMLWWLGLAIGMTVLGIFDADGALSYFLLRMLLAAFLLYAVRMSEMSARHAFEWGEKRTASAELVKKRTRFLAHVSHEIRTPLHVMILSQQLLLDTPLTVEQRAALEMAETSGDMVLALLRDTLDLAALDEGGIALHPAKIAVRDLCDIAPLTALAKSRGLRVHMSVSSRCPRTVVVDKSRIAQVVWNLVANSIKYTEVGTVTVRVDYATLDGELVWRGQHADALLVRVLDTGPGIPAGLEEVVFERFARALDADVAAGTAGIGLGLSIVKELVGLWNGRVGCCNRADRRGACFWFTVPVHPLDYDESEADEEALLSRSDVSPFTDSVSTAEHSGDQTPRQDVQHDKNSASSKSADSGARADRTSLTENVSQRSVSSSNRTSVTGNVSQRSVSSSTSSSGDALGNSGNMMPDAAIEPAILIADDNPANRKILEMYLRHVCSARLLLAVDGDDAATQWNAERDNVRLVLMDHHMPNCDGLDAAARIRSIEDALGRKRTDINLQTTFLTPSVAVWCSPTEQVPMLCVTASDAATDASGQYRAMQFDGVVSKPFHRDTIVKIMRYFCPDLLSKP